MILIIQYQTEGRISKILDTIDEKKADILKSIDDKLETTIENFNDKIAKINELLDDKTKITADLARMTGYINELENQSKNYKKRINNLEDEIINLNCQIANLKRTDDTRDTF